MNEMGLLQVEFLSLENENVQLQQAVEVHFTAVLLFFLFIIIWAILIFHLWKKFVYKMGCLNM